MSSLERTSRLTSLMIVNWSWRRRRSAASSDEARCGAASVASAAAASSSVALRPCARASCKSRRWSISVSIASPKVRSPLRAGCRDGSTSPSRSTAGAARAASTSLTVINSSLTTAAGRSATAGAGWAGEAMSAPHAPQTRTAPAAGRRDRPLGGEPAIEPREDGLVDHDRGLAGALPDPRGDRFVLPRAAQSLAERGRDVRVGGARRRAARPDGEEMMPERGVDHGADFAGLEREDDLEALGHVAPLHEAQAPALRRLGRRRLRGGQIGEGGARQQARARGGGLGPGGGHDLPRVDGLGLDEFVRVPVVVGLEFGFGGRGDGRDEA